MYDTGIPPEGVFAQRHQNKCARVCAAALFTPASSKQPNNRTQNWVVCCCGGLLQAGEMQWVSAAHETIWVLKIYSLKHR